MTIQLETIISAPITRCFDLARSIDLHKLSTGDTHEEAVDGTTSGLIGLNEFVTWEAVHFGVKQRLSSRITAFERPFHFRDEQIKGVFKYINHDHYFKQVEDHVIMTDIFRYQSPLGILGRIADVIFVRRYLENLLMKRNEMIRDFAESEKWSGVL